jgi:hypothetical protein
MIDDPSSPDTTPPPSTTSPDIAELSNQLQLVLGQAQDQAASSIASPITPSDPDFTPPVTATTSSSDPFIATPFSTEPDSLAPGSRLSHNSIATSSGQSDLDRRDSPAFKHSSLFPRLGQGRITKHFHRHPRPTCGPPFDPIQPIYWVGEAGKKTQCAQLLDYFKIQEDEAHLIKHVYHEAFDEEKGSDLRVTGDIVRVIHGFWNEHPSVFLGYNISHHGRKVSQTKVRVEVSAGGLLDDVEYQTYKANPSKHQPFIVRIAPRKHYGKATDVENAENNSLGGKIAGPTAMTATAVKADANRSKVYATEERHTIKGHISSSDSKHTLKTVFELEAEENPRTKAGVYEQFAMGMIIETRGKPVVVTLDITPTQTCNPIGWLRSIGGSKEPGAVPVWIGDGDWGLEGLPEGWPREMSQWNLEMWKQLVEYDDEGETVSRFHVTSSCSLADLGGLGWKVILPHQYTTTLVPDRYYPLRLHPIHPQIDSSTFTMYKIIGIALFFHHPHFHIHCT